MNYSFRAWHITHEEMLNRNSQQHEGQVFKWLHEGQPLSIMQGTGLLDIHGVEIYENDIVKWDDRSDGKYWRVAIVKTKPSLSFEAFNCPLIENSSSHGHRYSYGNFAYQDTHNHLEIIGNIFENEELLEN